MTGQLTRYISEKTDLINDKLIREITRSSIPDRLQSAMLYSIRAGGKRVRPLLMIASCEAYGGHSADVLAPAAALEMVHTYSLIHDDLPAMDNDDFRRGKPTSHKQFDEATAILAGDGLLTLGFEVIAKDASLSVKQRVRLLHQLAAASGPEGMVAGQVLDMQAEKQETDLDALEKMHALKTGRLLRYAVVEGAAIGGADKKQTETLEQYAYYLGLIFQVQDDILDIVGRPDLTGRPAGSDESNFKSTYPKLLGLEGARQQKEKYVTEATKLLKQAGSADSALLVLTDYLSNRDH